VDAKGQAVHIIADAIQRMRNEGLGSIDIAKSLSHAAAVLAGHEDDWEWEWGGRIGCARAALSLPTSVGRLVRALSAHR
jgi:hypothetical protein